MYYIIYMIYTLKPFSKDQISKIDETPSIPSSSTEFSGSVPSATTLSSTEPRHRTLSSPTPPFSSVPYCIEDERVYKNKTELNPNKIIDILFNIIYLIVYLTIKQCEPKSYGFNENFHYYEKLINIIIDLFMKIDVLKYNFFVEIKNDIIDELLLDPTINSTIIKEKILIYYDLNHVYSRVLERDKNVDRNFLDRIMKNKIIKNKLFINIPFLIKLNELNNLDSVVNTITNYVKNYKFDNDINSDYYYKKIMDDFLDELREEFNIDTQKYKYENDFSFYRFFYYISCCFCFRG